MKTQFNLLAVGTLLISSFALGMVTIVYATKPQPKVICESGAEFHDVRLFNDPYYKYSIDCKLGDSNGPQVIVEIID